MATDSRIKYEDALANLNKGGLTGSTLSMAQNNLKNYYAAAPGATGTTPTNITTPQNSPTQSAPQGEAEAVPTPPVAQKNTAYDSAMSSYLDALQGSNRANEASDTAGIAARRGYLDTLNAPGGLKQGAQESASVFSRNANANLADLGVAQNAASNASQVALERLKYEQGQLPKPGEAFNLSPGETRYDASGKQIATGLPKTPSISEKYGTGAIGEYNFAKDNGYTGSFSQYQNEDANRKAKAAGGTSNTLSRDQLAAGEAKLRASKGPDGYVDPNVYLQAFNGWPGTSAEFLSKFPPKNYVNPANTWLPEILRPKASGRSI